MEPKIAEALSKIKVCWQNNGLSINPSKTAAINAMVRFLDENQLDYSQELALEWLETSKYRLPNREYYKARRALYEFNDVIVTGSISGNYKYELTPYDSLPESWRKCIDAYQQARLSVSTPSCASHQAEQVVNFAVFLEGSGIHNESGITGKLVAEYLSQERVSKGMYSGVVAMRYFLQHLSDNNIVPSHLPLAATSPVQASGLGYALENIDVIKIGELSNDEFQERLSPEEYWKMSLKMIKNLTGKLKHSEKNVRDAYTVHLQMLYVLLSELKADYSPSVSAYWVSLMDGFPSFRGFSEARKHCMDAFSVYCKHGNVFQTRKIPHIYRPDVKMAKLSDWSRDIVLKFSEDDVKDNLSQSTVETHRSGAVSFMLFMEQNGICSPDMITPALVKEYNNAVAAMSCNGKNNYLYGVKSFLRFMFSASYTNKDLSRCMPSHNAISRRIVEILPASYIEIIEQYCENAQTPMELRDAAILSLALYMGLRGIDIINLKYSDIDWKNMTISISQQKTYRPVVLPVSLLIGDRIRNYILNGRPKIPNGYVFLSHTSPFSNSGGTHICIDALKRATEGKYGSFHILRRTFASRLLATGSDTSTIKDSLGHSDYSSVDRYLSTDKANERLCCLPIERTVMRNETSA
jgi:site-specific recombinase XerD